MNHKSPIKCVFAGASGVGKTAIYNRMKLKEFTPSNIVTVGNNFELLKVKYEDEDYTIQLWDTAGQEQYQSIAVSVFRSAKVIILVFDLTSPDSFLDLERWMIQIREKCSPDIGIVLLGNKCDIGSDNIKQEQIDEFTAKYNISVYLETSALNGTNIDEISFCCISEANKYQQTLDQQDQVQIDLNEPQKDKGCSC